MLKKKVSKEGRKITKENRRIINQYEKQRKRRKVPEDEYLIQMTDSNNAVEFENLHAYYYTDAGTVKSVDGITFDVPTGKTVGIVGESGCGKSVTCLSLMQLLQRPQGQITKGSIRLNLGNKAIEITRVPEEKMQSLRGNAVSMIFQEPMTCLNPVFRVGHQVDEVICLHNGKSTSGGSVKACTIQLLDSVGIANSAEVYRLYPHELSGGMRQRVCIAMALACKPCVIVADEPTTALDVTIQAQVLDIFQQLKNNTNTSILFVTHDLGVIAQMADFVVIMYAGRIVEKGTVAEIFSNPAHPYTIGLMASNPAVTSQADQLYSIPGKVPDPIHLPDYCYFKDRCEKCIESCDGKYPKEISLSPTHKVCCYLYYSERRQADAETKPSGNETDSHRI